MANPHPNPHPHPNPTPTPKQVRLLCKGADSVMLKLLKSGQQEAVEATERIMEDHRLGLGLELGLGLGLNL